jgi:alkylation response protein AidB-like acyl-CoA dehydrogenase
MDFVLTKEQQDVKRAAREFAEGEFSNIAQDFDEEETYPRDLVKKAAGLGFIGINFPEEYGGGGYGYLEKCLIAEEFCRVDPGLGAVVISADFGADMVNLHGTAGQKKRYLSPLTRGEAVMGAAVTEANCGNNASVIAFKAERDGDGYVISGKKMFVTNGTVASYLAVICLTNPGYPSRQRKQSVIMVEADQAGFEVRKLDHKLGNRASDTAEVYLKKVRVPRENLVGDEGNGFTQVMRFLDVERVLASAICVGTAQACLQTSLTYAKGRIQFGRPIAEFQLIREKLAEMAVAIELARTYTYRGAWMIDQGLPIRREAAIAKVYSSGMAVRAGLDAIQIHGGYGYMKELPVERYFRDAKIWEIGLGTPEIQKLIIARELENRGAEGTWIFR